MTIRLFFLLIPFCFSCKNKNLTSQNEAKPKEYTSFHDEAQKFIETNHFNSSFYFLIDMSIHSGKNRFFVYNFDSKKFTHQKLTTHGTCDRFESNPDKYSKAKFSNKTNSHCSSVGKYKIGKRDYSSWGIKVKYWLHGLEDTNNNAIKRVVVLHSWEAVEDYEIFPKFSLLSWGCPAVSNDFMKTLDEMLKKTSKPTLLWIIE